MGSDFQDLTRDLFLNYRSHPPAIYTLGTGTRRLEEFIEILDSYGILRVVDVRRFPTSRLEHFKKANLEAALRARGLQYEYLGRDLGGYRKGGYEVYMDSFEFNRGLEALILLAREKITVVVCAERFAWKCHRRFIGAALEKKGWLVLHVIDKDRIWKTKQSEKGDLSGRR